MARLDPYDVLAVLGVLLLAIGLYMVYVPLALIVPGVLLILVAGLGASRRGNSRGPERGEDS